MENVSAIADAQSNPVARRRSRRRGQAGSIFKRGSNGWTIIYRANGKQVWEGGFRTKDEARTRLDAVLKTIRDNRYVARSDVIFGDFCDGWMEKAKGMLKPKTWESYQSALRNWICPKQSDEDKNAGKPLIGFRQWYISDISRAAVKDFVDQLIANSDLSRKFVKNVVILLHRLFEEAVDRELIAANPAHRIKLPKTETEALIIGDAALEDDVIVPTTDEVARTFAELPRTYQALLATSAVTGVRRGELLGLFWDDIDWLNGVLNIRRTLQRVKKSLLDSGGFRGLERIGSTGLALVTPKSKRARRRVELPPRVTAMLLSLRDEQIPDCPFVFRSELSGPIDPDAVYDVLHAAQDKAGVRRFGLHGLRHLYSSLLVASGADVKFAQERLGHASATTTLDIYSHAITDRGGEYALKIDAAFPFVSLKLAKAVGAGEQQEAVN